ncbi:MAG: AEC family transporter [Pseudomonadota bacterium]
MSAVLAVALPVFAVITAGFLAGRRRILSADDVAALNRFVFRLTMPAALFGLVAGAAPLGEETATLAGVYALAAAAALAVGYATGRFVFSLSPAVAGAHAFASTLGNAVFLGLPIALSIEGWAPAFVSLMLVEGVFVIAVGAALMDANPNKRLTDYFLAPLRNPLVVAMLAGVAVSLARASLAAAGAPNAIPQPIETFLSILGRAAGPTALVSMGLFLATTPLPPLRDVGGKVAAVFVVKMIALPAVMFVGLKLTGLVDDQAIAGPAMLFALVPSGVGSFVMASQYGVYAREAAAAIAVTTAASVLTVAGVLAAYAG